MTVNYRQYLDACSKYGLSLDDIQLGMERSGSPCPYFGARYVLADGLAVCVKGGLKARHLWNMRRAGESE